MPPRQPLALDEREECSGGPDLDVAPEFLNAAKSATKRSGCTSAMVGYLFHARIFGALRAVGAPRSRGTPTTIGATTV